MAYNWTADLETGNSKIDEQHKQLITAINNLLAACSAGKGRDVLKETTTFLYEYTSKHFADEERLQQASHYPDYVNHKRYHEEFKKVVRDLMSQLEKDGPTLVLVGKVNSSIAGWLISHIKKEDVKVAAHIRSNSK
ncbi:bacteriohemerythrin [Sinanaerobacter sp. ZZT-01]|uniref:bacteriohemerythrin n=1 Tax=Sinanaerobacter sp. ZZT-01 TaxID=3111540 RepID=UPI002D76D57F|nr:bacteriohemerythrin [Sinanaerobacter sp. ZZT-01]WRR94427.1 bacteriohemerythrin [Sinanaerobacter sp. ZZT-01]